MIFLVCFEMLGEAVDALCDQCDLDFSGPGVRFVDPMGLDGTGFRDFRNQPVLSWNLWMGRSQQFEADLPGAQVYRVTGLRQAVDSEEARGAAEVALE